MIRLAIVLLLALVAPTQAQTQQGVVVMKKWQAADKCARQAQTMYPDFTAVDQAKRNAQLRTCLESENLPPRAPLAPHP